MKIIGSQASPFVRIVRATCEMQNIDYILDETGSFVNMSDADRQLIEENNPLMKVPVLIDAGQVVIDSRVIIAYLMKRKNAAMPDGAAWPLTDEQENIITVLNGIADAAVLRFIFANTSDLDMNAGYLLRSLKRIESGLVYLNNQAEQNDLGQNFGVPELVLVCILEWFQKRSIIDFSNHRPLCDIVARYRDVPCLVKTRIPETA